MEEFKNLNWLWKTNRSTTSKLYETNFSDDEKDIFFCHINEIDQIHLLDDYGRSGSFSERAAVKDPRTGREITKHVLDRRASDKTYLFPNFREKSSMNSEQHRSCLNAIANRKRDPATVSMSDPKDVQIYEQLKVQRIKEKAKFLQFVEGEFFRRNINNCYDLNPELEKFFTKRCKEAIDKTLKVNENYYQLQSAVPITNQNCGDGGIIIQFEKTIAKSGVVLAMNRKKYTNPIQLSCAFLEHFFLNDSVNFTVPSEELLQRHSVDVVISLTTLTSMLNFVKNLSANWNLTFTINERGNQKVIFFDEILPAKTLDCLEKNRRAYKYGVAATIAVAKKKRVFCFEGSNFIERTQPLFDKVSEPIPPEPLRAYRLWGYEDYLNTFCSSFPADNRTADSNNHIQRLWNIQRNGVNCFRLLIHSRQDFCEEQKDGSVQFINLSPKVEYQCEFGAEQMTLSELISEWCELRFGPDTVTDRVRINSRSSCVIETEQITLADVEHDLERLHQAKMEPLLESVLNLMDILKRFPLNEYLLRHEEKHNSQAMVYVKSNESRSSTNVIRIADIYNSGGQVKPILWNPIDDTVCTMIHKQSSVMPCAFPHWGKKKNCKPNDRTLLLKRAERNANAKSKAIAEREAMHNQKKKLAKCKKRKAKLTIQKQTKETFKGESIDPYELFDEQGNVQISNFVTRNEDNDQKGETNQLEEGMCYETYRRDAALTSYADSFD